MIKQVLFTNWHTMRWVALCIAIFFATLAIIDQEIVTALFSGFFFFQALTNKGCMVSQSCGLPTNAFDQSDDQESEPEFTEVK
jgi:hypothetical protein|tara:strand:- start:22 stop:270 length:249 start_codon:yes stop_codon:yes gene_type:complete